MPFATRATDPTTIARRILVLRGQRVMLDADLAQLYGVPTSRLNEQVRRNLDRFPEDFAFRLTKHELTILMSHSATSSWGGRRKPPLVFTEHGAIMAATVLNSPRAAEMAVFVVRAFVKLRQFLESNSELARKLEALERSVAMLDAGTRRQFEEVYQAIRALMAPPAGKTRPIGFTADLKWSEYDALVSISLSDKARTVVDAMERDMGTTLATKQDLRLLAGSEDLLETKRDLELAKKDISNRIALLEQRTKAEFARLDQKIDTLQLQMTLRLGFMLIVGFGLTIAAMRLWV